MKNICDLKLFIQDLQKTTTMKTLVYASIIFFVAFLVKEYKIEKGNFVIWDEAHFGKFSQNYLSRSFYFDVHPPLGKLLTALSGYLFGQSEAFLFSSSDSFPDSFDYVGMRRFHALLGSIVPVAAFLTLCNLNFSKRRAFISSFIFIFENGMTSIMRLILLDSHLLLFTALTVLFLSYHWKSRQKGVVSHSILFLLGLSIGCATSVKWIGCLTMLFAGLYIIYDLDKTLQQTTLYEFSILFALYAFYLILIPLLLYVLLFYIHFRIVNNSSGDDGFVSIPFQMTLNGSPFRNTRKYISFGQQITLKNKRGYLHSHKHTYPDHNHDSNGRLLQATTYSAKDTNNNLYFQKVTEDQNADFLTDGDKIVILHAETKAYFEVQNDNAYFSDGNKVGAREGPLSTGSIWKVVKKQSSNRAQIKTVYDEFYLQNEELGCFLSGSDSTYPSWGYGQGEVFCSKAKTDDSIFIIEENFFSEKKHNPIYSELSSSFLAKFGEHHILMWNTNKSFLQDPDLEPDLIVSKPYEWPVLYRGMRMSRWEENHKFYMFFNPFLVLTCLLSVGVGPIRLLLRWIKIQRNTTMLKEKINTKNDTVAKKLLPKNMKIKNADAFILFIGSIGWALHYLPFFIVARVLYIHHYLPAFYFSMFSLCFLLNKISFKWHCTVVLITAIFYCIFSPLTYGFISNNDVMRLKIFPSWDFIDS